MPLASSTEENQAADGEKTPVAEDVKLPVEDEKLAESSAADGKDEKSPASMLDALKAASKPGAAKSSNAKTEGDDKPSDADSTKAGAKKPGEDEDEPLGDVTEEELKGYHSKTRRRVKQLLKRAETAEKQLGDFQPRAEAYDRLVGFVNDAGLTRDEVNVGFEVMKQMKRDPWKALETLRPYYEALLQATGNVLPADLQEKVKGGYMSEADARETASLRARTLHQSAAETQRQEQDRLRADADRQREAGAAISSAFTQWETAKATSDPDWATKAKFVARELKARWASGDVPRTPEEAHKQAEDVLKSVEADLKPLRPMPKEIRQPTGGSSPSAQPAPTTTLEALKRVTGR